jgi:hypothetical protein
MLIDLAPARPLIDERSAIRLREEAFSPNLLRTRRRRLHVGELASKVVQIDDAGSSGCQFR